MSYNQTVSSCFENIIGIRGYCDDPVSKSMLWSNDIGISKEFLDAIVTEDFANGLDLYKKKLEFATNTIQTKVYSAFQDRYKSFSMIENQRIGFYKDNLQYQSPIAGNYVGIHLQLTNYESFVDFLLSELTLQINEDAQKEISIWDLMTGKVIKTITIDCLADEVTQVFPDFKFLSDRKKINLFIGYDAGTSRYNDTKLVTSGACTSCGGGAKYTNKYVQVTGAKLSTSAQAVDENVISIGNTGGLSITYSLSCNHREWMCSAMNILAIPIYYEQAFQLMDFAISSSPNVRLNNTSWLNSELLSERRQQYYDMAEKEFTNALKNISPPSDSLCFTCREPVKYATMLP